MTFENKRCSASVPTSIARAVPLIGMGGILAQDNRRVSLLDA